MRRSSPELSVRWLTTSSFRRVRNAPDRSEDRQSASAQPPLESGLQCLHAPGRDGRENEGNEPER